jgi:hypothetical protein
MDTRYLDVAVVFTEDDQRTEAQVRTVVRGREFAGRGQSRRNPRDPNVPEIGEELALARALADLSHELVDAATASIEAREGHPVFLPA